MQRSQASYQDAISNSIDVGCMVEISVSSQSLVGHCLCCEFAAFIIATMAMGTHITKSKTEELWKGNKVVMRRTFAQSTRGSIDIVEYSAGGFLLFILSN